MTRPMSPVTLWLVSLCVWDFSTVKWSLISCVSRFFLGWERPIGEYFTLVISAPCPSSPWTWSARELMAQARCSDPTYLDYSMGRKKSLFVSEGREQQVAGKVLSVLRGQVTSRAEVQARMTWAVAWELRSVAGCSETRPLCPK